MRRGARQATAAPRARRRALAGMRLRRGLATRDRRRGGQQVGWASSATGSMPSMGRVAQRPGMKTYESHVDPRSAEFEANRAAYGKLVRVLRERQQVVLDGGPGRERAIERHLARGKLMVRDRIDCVIDAGTPFLELSTLSGWGQYDDGAPGAGIVTGIGLVHGVPY